MSGLQLLLNTLAEKGYNPRRNGSGWTARCPAHDDQNPSLSISEGTNGVPLWHCHAGCAQPDIPEALGIPIGDLAERTNGHSDGVVATYDYVDEDGKLLFQVVRKPGKRFVQRRPDGHGDWEWKLGDTRRVLYRLPQVLKGIADGATIFVVEGEKDADRLEADGYVVTCNPHGAGKWRPEYNASLEGADVVVVADRDQPGLAHARDVARHLDGIAAQVRITEPADGKDVSDHLAAGRTVEELVVVNDATVPIATYEETYSEAPPSTNGHTTAIPPAVATRLPDEFWTARDSLRHIRQAAHARQRSADAVLHVVLARIAAINGHTTWLPAIVGDDKPLCYFAAPISPPGIGKSDANSIGCRLIPAPAYVADQLPLGSGEGLAEVLFDTVDEVDEKGRDRQVKRQVRHNAYVYVDEGQVLSDLGARNGSTLLPTLRTIWSGGVLGQTNASKERRRIVPALSYTYGIVAGFQVARVGPLLDDVDAGTPQRFGWCYATDPSVPDDLPEWPGPLEWEPMPVIHGGRYLEVAPEIEDEIRTLDKARVRGEVAVDPLDAQGGLYRLKVAGLLAVLDGRRDITLKDWALAGMIKTASDAVRTNVVNALAYEQQRKEQVARERYARREVEADSAKEQRRIVDCARKIADKVWSRKEPWLVTEMRKTVRRPREIFDGGLDHAEVEGWVAETTEPGQGSDKRLMIRGETRPT